MLCRCSLPSYLGYQLNHWLSLYNVVLETQADLDQGILRDEHDVSEITNLVLWEMPASGYPPPSLLMLSILMELTHYFRLQYLYI